MVASYPVAYLLPPGNNDWCFDYGIVLQLHETPQTGGLCDA